MLHMSARTRPKRSAKTPKKIPPTAEAAKVTEASEPPVVVLMFRSTISVAKTSA